MTQPTSSAGPEPRAATQALSPEAKPQRGPEHEKLAVFLGDWRGEGTGGAGSPMTTTTGSRGSSSW